MQVYNQTRNQALATRGEKPRSLLGRMRGLLGRKEMGPGSAMLLTSCRWIHTFFMKFPIDVLFLDQNLKVVAMANRFPPNRVSRPYFRANITLELPAGMIEKSHTRVGDQLIMIGDGDDDPISC